MSILAASESLVPLAQLASPLVLLGSVTVALFAVRENARVSKMNKIADVTMHCNSRYDEVYKFKIDLIEMENPSSTLINQYFARYWGLKSDEFDYWMDGFIDIETFTSWFYSTLNSFREDNPVCGVTFRQGWETVGLKDNQVVNPLFLQFIEEIIEIASKNGRMETPFEKLLEVIERLEVVAVKWRKGLRRDMPLKEYRTSLREWRHF